MHIEKIKIKNYRLLKEFELDLEKNLSLVIGKNNSGKTSLLSILEKFIGDKSKKDLSFDDFNIEFKNEFKNLLEGPQLDEINFPFLGISLKLFIKYDDTDDLSNISEIMMDLNPENKTIVLGFEYKMPFVLYRKLRFDFQEFKIKEGIKTKAKAESNNRDNISPPAELIVSEAGQSASATTTIEDIQDTSSETGDTKKDVCYFLRQNHAEYFKRFEKTIEYNIDDAEHPFENDQNFIDLGKEKVQLSKIINFKLINAKRDVSNKVEISLKVTT